MKGKEKYIEFVATESDYYKILNKDRDVLLNLDNACNVYAASIYQKCRGLLNRKYGDYEFAEKNPELLAALMNSATAIFVSQLESNKQLKIEK
jgi:hypothetical protein